MSSNWSCILYQQHIVIHCEESDAAYQHFYPLSVLRTYISQLRNKDATPVISQRVPPSRTVKKKFIFPLFIESDSEPDLDGELEGNLTNGLLQDLTTAPNIPITNGNANYNSQAGPSTSAAAGPSMATANSSSSLSSLSSVSSHSSTTSSLSSSSSMVVTAANNDNPNPYPFPPWYPESAHFVRQWWPSLPNIPRVSCTVVLLAAHDPQTHRTRFVLAQHYFRVPLDHSEWDELELENAGNIPISEGKQPEVGSRSTTANGNAPAAATTNAASGCGSIHPTPRVEDAQDDALMHLWYVSTPFEVVRVFDGPDEEEDGAMAERPRPLVAVDFGHAVWIEYVDIDEEHRRNRPDGDIEKDPKWLRFVTFPPFSEEYGVELDRSAGGTEGEVRTLETPSELDLGTVETINIDQSQGAIILSDKAGRIFILCYE